jgi:hypothetical protein
LFSVKCVDGYWEEIGSDKDKKVNVDKIKELKDDYLIAFGKYDINKTPYQTFEAVFNNNTIKFFFFF